MTVTDEEVERFRRAWQEDFGELLSPEIARAELTRLLEFFIGLAREFHGRQARPEDSAADDAKMAA